MNDTSGTSIGDKDKVLTGFPSFYMEEQENLGYLAYGGIMVGDTHRASGKYVINLESYHYLHQQSR